MCRQPPKFVKLVVRSNRGRRRRPGGAGEGLAEGRFHSLELQACAGQAGGGGARVVAVSVGVPDHIVALAVAEGDFVPIARLQRPDRRPLLAVGEHAAVELKQRSSRPPSWYASPVCDPQPQAQPTV